MCDCVNRMNEGIADRGIRIARGFVIVGNKLMARTMVATERAGVSRKKPPTVFASYCPFCGVAENPTEQCMDATPEPTP